MSRIEHAEASRALWVAASATLLVLAVFSAVVTTVGDSLQTLHGGVSGQTWTLSGMSLGLAVALLTVGALADAFGRRRVLVVSSALLALTSALGAVAPSMNALIAARILQGVARAGIIAAALGAIGHAFPAGHSRAHATSVWGSAVGAGIAIGPLAAGALAASLGWRSSFWLEAIADELGRFSNPLFAASLTGALFTGLAVIGLMSFTPLLLQRGLHVSVLGSAGVLAAWSGTSMAVALATRRLLGRRSAASVVVLGCSQAS